MYGLAVRPLMHHAVAHAPVLAAYLHSATQRGRAITITPGPGTVGARSMLAGKDVVGEWARRVIAQHEFPLSRNAQGDAVAPNVRSFAERLSGVMRSVIRGEKPVVAPKNRAEMLDDLAPVSAGREARSTGLAGYETRSQSMRRDVAALVTLGGVAFNLDQMPPALREKIEVELGRAMSYYKRVALTPGRVADLQPYQLHALLTLGVMRVQQALRVSSGLKPTVDVQALDARVIDDGQVDGDKFEEMVGAGTGQLKTAAAAAALGAGMGVGLNEIGDTEGTVLHDWMAENGRQYESAVDQALEEEGDLDRPANRPTLQLVDREDEKLTFNPTPFPSMAQAPRPGA